MPTANTDIGSVFTAVGAVAAVTLLVTICTTQNVR